MSLPAFSLQGELFSTAGLSTSLFAEPDRYRLFANRIFATGGGGMRQVVDLQAGSAKSLLYISTARLAVILGGGCDGRLQPSCSSRSCRSFSGCV